MESQSKGYSSEEKQGPNSIEKKILPKILPRFHVLENHKKWVAETGLRIKVVSRQDFRQDFWQDFLSIELGPWL